MWVLQLELPRTPSPLSLSHSPAIILTDDVIAPGFQLTAATNQTALATSWLATAEEVELCTVSETTLSHGKIVPLMLVSVHCPNYRLYCKRKRKNVLFVSASGWAVGSPACYPMCTGASPGGRADRVSN